MFASTILFDDDGGAKYRNESNRKHKQRVHAATAVFTVYEQASVRPSECERLHGTFVHISFFLQK